MNHKKEWRVKAEYISLHSSTHLSVSVVLVPSLSCPLGDPLGEETEGALRKNASVEARDSEESLRKIPPAFPLGDPGPAFPDGGGGEVAGDKLPPIKESDDRRDNSEPLLFMAGVRDDFLLRLTWFASSFRSSHSSMHSLLNFVSLLIFRLFVK